MVVGETAEILEFILKFFMCAGVLPACMCVHHMYVWCPWITWDWSYRQLVMVHQVGAEN